MMTIEPQAILDDLKSRATKRKIKSLDLIYRLLQKQTQSGVMDFSIATIGRLSSAAGGPSTQAIRNKGGESYRRVIEAWAAAQGTTTKKPLASTHRQQPPPKDDDVLRRIEDPALRAVIGTFIAERNKLYSENRLLKSQSEIVVDRRPAKREVPQTVEVLPSLSGLLTDMEREALREAISDKTLADRGWKTQVNGRVKDENGRLLYKPGYITAIAKILKCSDLRT